MDKSLRMKAGLLSGFSFTSSTYFDSWIFSSAVGSSAFSDFVSLRGCSLLSISSSLITNDLPSMSLFGLLLSSSTLLALLVMMLFFYMAVLLACISLSLARFFSISYTCIFPRLIAFWAWVSMWFSMNNRIMPRLPLSLISGMHRQWIIFLAHLSMWSTR